MKYANTKIRIKSPEHSKAFQEEVFAAGGAWVTGKKVKNLESSFLFVSNNGIIWPSDCDDFFGLSTEREINWPE